MNSARFSIWLLLTAALSLSGPAHGATPVVANLSFLTGDVKVETHGSTANGVRGQSLGEGDTVKTGSDGTAILTLPDHSLVKLNSATRLSLITLTGRTQLDLQAGAVFSKVEKQKELGRFQIRTKSAVMGVRGTEFFTAFGHDSPKGADMWMCVNEGAVEVENLADHKQVLVHQGEGIFLPAGKGITPPKPYDWTHNLNWSMQPEKGSVIDRTQIEYKDLLKQDYD